CPLRPMAATWAPAAPPACGSDSRTAPTVACHHTSGSCSDHLACGTERVCGQLAAATTRPEGSTRAAFVEEVPISIPSSIGEGTLAAERRANKIGLASAWGIGYAGRTALARRFGMPRRLFAGCGALRR